MIRKPHRRNYRRDEYLCYGISLIPADLEIYSKQTRLHAEA